MIIGSLQVSSTGGNAKYGAYLRIYQPATEHVKKQLIAEACIPCYQPLKYIRKWPNGIHATDLLATLKRAGVSEQDIGLLFKGE